MASFFTPGELLKFFKIRARFTAVIQLYKAALCVRTRYVSVDDLAFRLGFV